MLPGERLHNLSKLLHFHIILCILVDYKVRLHRRVRIGAEIAEHHFAVVISACCTIGDQPDLLFLLCLLHLVELTYENCLFSGLSLRKYCFGAFFLQLFLPTLTVWLYRYFILMAQNLCIFLILSTDHPDFFVKIQKLILYMQEKRQLLCKWHIFSVGNIVHFIYMSICACAPADKLPDLGKRNVHDIQLLNGTFFSAPAGSFQCIFPSGFIGVATSHHICTVCPAHRLHNGKFTVQLVFFRLEYLDTEIVIYGIQDRVCLIRKFFAYIRIIFPEKIYFVCPADMLIGHHDLRKLHLLQEAFDTFLISALFLFIKLLVIKYDISYFCAVIQQHIICIFFMNRIFFSSAVCDLSEKFLVKYLQLLRILQHILPVLHHEMVRKDLHIDIFP